MAALLLSSLRPGVANGEKTDLTGGDWGYLLLCGAILVVDAVFVIAPIALSSRRRSPWGELVLAGSLFWGLGVAWTSMGALTAVWKWAKDQNTLMLAGYRDTAVADPAPRLPWGWWAALLGLYVLLLCLAWGRKRRPPEPGPAETAKSAS